MAAHLMAEARGEGLSLYRVGGEPGSVVEYVFSTPETRAICNIPEIVGHEFTELLKSAFVRVLRAPPLARSFGGLDDRSVSVLHFLRGGLNFRLREALAEAYGMNRHFSSFLTSQRYRRRREWIIKQDQYRKFSIPPGCHLFLGDVIATGTTISNGLAILHEHCLEQKVALRSFTLFTIGCGRALEMMRRFDGLFRKSFPGYEGTTVCYAEAKFGLPEAGTRLTLAVPGTDLLRAPALLSPEFERSQFEALHTPLERCAIYDVGTRSFEFDVYLKDVIDYWRALAATGLTLEAAYAERWPTADYASLEALAAARAPTWKGLPEGFVADLYAAFERLWTPARRAEAATAGALAALCSGREAALGAQLGAQLGALGATVPAPGILG